MLEKDDRPQTKSKASKLLLATGPADRSVKKPAAGKGGTRGGGGGRKEQEGVFSRKADKPTSRPDGCASQHRNKKNGMQNPEQLSWGRNQGGGKQATTTGMCEGKKREQNNVIPQKA